MKRYRYQFPLPRHERITLDCLQDAEFLVPFLEVDRSSVSKKVKPLRRPARTQLRRINAPEPDVCEESVPDPEEVTEVPEPVTVEIIPDEGTPVIPEVVSAPVRVVKDRVSVIMAHRGRDRLDGLKRSIASLRAQSRECFIILVEQDREPVLRDVIEPLVDRYLFTFSPFLFNKSWAFNCGAMLANDEFLLLHDSDLIAPENYVREAIQILGKSGVALPWTRILYLTEESSILYPEEPLRVSHTFSSHQVCGGSLLVRREFYLEIGGMDERCEGWGGEDNAFFIKACKLGKVGRAHPVKGPTLIHYYHPLAPKSHRHYNINSHVMSEYYSRPVRDIKMRIKSLFPIGNPVKYDELEKKQQQVSLVYL